jgi:hypothetical protein
MAVTVPEKWVLELLEAARGGTADTYEKFLKYCDMAISNVRNKGTGRKREKGPGLRVPPAFY